MADWDGLRRDLEGSVSTPPLQALRERRRRRQQRRAIAMTSVVVMVGSAAGVAVLGRAEQMRKNGPTASLDVVVNSSNLPPPKDYEDPVVTDVDFVSPNVGWAIGLRCIGESCDVATWRTGDGGRTWSAPSTVASGIPRVTFKEESPSGGAVRSLRMVDERNGFAFNPGLYATHDGGATWQRLPQQSKATSVSIAGDTFWVTERGCAIGVDCDLVVRTGTVPVDTLQPLANLPETNGASAIVRRAGTDNGYLVSWGLPRAAFHRTTDAGATWTEGVNPCPDASAVSLSAGVERPLWLVCTTPRGRTAFQSDDHGTTWRPLAKPPADGVVTDLIARSADDAYLTTQQPARLFVTADGGATWQQAEGTGDGFGYGNLDVVDATHAWAMGDAGILWRTTDGRTWERLALPPGKAKVPTPTAPPPTVRAGGDEWVSWRSLNFSDLDHGWAIGSSCTESRCHALLRRTTDGARTWQELAPPSETYASNEDPYNRVVFADARTGYLAGRELWVTRDAGGTWQWIESGTVASVAVDDGYVWLVETAPCAEQECFSRLRRAPVGSDVFTTVLTKGDVASREVGLTVEGSDRAYVFGDGALLVTSDGGHTWSARTLPCKGALTRSLDAIGGHLWTMCGYEGGTGSQPHRTAHSVDGGRTWIEKQSTDGTGYLTFFSALSPTVAWRGDGGIASDVKVTRDGGITWQRVPAPEEVVSAGGPSAMQVLDANHGYGLFNTTYFARMTNGRSWELIEGPTPRASGL